MNKLINQLNIEQTLLFLKQELIKQTVLNELVNSKKDYSINCRSSEYYMNMYKILPRLSLAVPPIL